MAFHPNPGDRLHINTTAYIIGKHPAAPGLAYAQAGRQGVVYQLLPEDGDLSRAAALKVFLPKYRIPSYVHLAQMMAGFSDINGLRVCQREVLTPERNGALIAKHPDLLYAVIMPWIEGNTWLDVLAGGEDFSRRDSLAAAKALSSAGSAMEQRGIAHSDLSAPNVMFVKESGYSQIELVDVEQMYSPRLDPPDFHFSGSPGYASYYAGTEDSQPAWNAFADRLPGSVMIAEMLGWSDEEVRKAAWGESYFDPAEIQSEGPRFELLRQSLERNFGKGPAELLLRAWNSRDPRSCPSFGEWVVALSEIQADLQAENGLQTAQEEAEAGMAAEEKPMVLSGRETFPSADKAVSLDTTPYGEEAEAALLMEQARATETSGRFEEALSGYEEALRRTIAGSPLQAELNAAISGLRETLAGQLQLAAARDARKAAGAKDAKAAKAALETKQGKQAEGAQAAGEAQAEQSLWSLWTKRAFRRRRLWLVGCAAAVILLAVAVLFALPDGWAKSSHWLTGPEAAAPSADPAGASLSPGQDDPQTQPDQTAEEEAAKRAEADRLAKEKAEQQAAELAAQEKAAQEKAAQEKAAQDQADQQKKAELQKKYDQQAKYNEYLVWKKNKDTQLAKEKADKLAAERKAALEDELKKVEQQRKAKELQDLRDQKMVKLIAYYNSAYNAQKTGMTDKVKQYANDFIQIYNTDAQYFVKTAPIGKRVGHVYRFLQDSQYELPNV